MICNNLNFILIVILILLSYYTFNIVGNKKINKYSGGGNFKSFITSWKFIIPASIAFVAIVIILFSSFIRGSRNELLKQNKRRLDNKLTNIEATQDNYYLECTEERRDLGLCNDTFLISTSS